MFVPLPAPLLAVDVGAVISVAILIIGFLGWIRQQVVNAQAQAPPPRPPRLPRRDDRIQNEIDIFLQEVGGKRKERPEDVPIEIVPDEERRNRPQPARGPRPQRRPESNRPREMAGSAPRPSAGMGIDRPPARRGSQPLSERQIDAPASFGSTDSLHLPPAPASSLAERPAQDRLTHEISQLASRKPAHEVEMVAATRAQQLAAVLRDPVGVRQAIMVNELLSRPKALRHSD